MKEKINEVMMSREQAYDETIKVSTELAKIDLQRAELIARLANLKKLTLATVLPATQKPRRKAINAMHPAGNAQLIIMALEEHGALTGLELSKQTGLTMAQVRGYLSPLHSSGYVRKVGDKQELILHREKPSE